MPGPSYCQRTKHYNNYSHPIINNWERVITLCESEDPHACYSFDDYALCELDDEYYVINTSGCSCPAPAEVWDVLFSGTKSQVEEYLSQSVNIGEARNEFLREVYKLGWNVPNPEPGKRYDW